jgi:hypothetical protein
MQAACDSALGSTTSITVVAGNSEWPQTGSTKPTAAAWPPALDEQPAATTTCPAGAAGVLPKA